MSIVERHALMDEVLSIWGAALGRAQRPYTAHVYRVYNYARHLLGSDQGADLLAVASAFHDIGIWSDRTFDYLAPSSTRAVEFAVTRMPHLSSELLEITIENHHRLRRIHSGSEPAVADAFRRADWIDVTRGLVRSGLDRGFQCEVVQAFPYSGFHALLLKTALAWASRHPLRPLPMLRF